MKKKDGRMRHITRIDQFKKHQHGWWVRIQRKGRMIHHFFSDVAQGSESAALRAAKRYRNELLRLYPKPEHGNMFNKPNSRNTSGIAGVHKTRSIKRGRYYNVWQAGWILPNGKRINRKFHFSLDGNSEAKAKKLAIQARKEGLALIAEIAAKQKMRREARRKAAKKF